MTPSSFAHVLIRFLALTLVVCGGMDLMGACIGVSGEMDLHYIVPFLKISVAPALLRLIVGGILWGMAPRLAARLAP